MTAARRFDVEVVGAGPAGSVAALVLARGGARVALVDKARFPRDKACGDLVGPRGVRLLEELGVLPDGRPLGDMEVVGPSGRRVVLPAPPGRTYPGHALSVRRTVLDAALRDAALSAGAVAVAGRAGTPVLSDDGELDGFLLDGEAADRREVRADVVVGADGALSRVAAVRGLVDEPRVLWGFAMRGYGGQAPSLPRIDFLEPRRWSGRPGYGWAFPGDDGVANVGVGAAGRGDRRFGARVVADLEAFRASLPGSPTLRGQLGGWLKLGLVGTRPAAGRTLLAGDAAGLVNPLQGEGISQALASGRMAAESILAAGPSGAAARYRRALADRFAGYAAQAAPVTALFVRRPRLSAAAARALTAPGVGRVLSGPWALYWNDLVDGAAPGPRQRGAVAASALASLLTCAAADRRAIRAAFSDTGAAGVTAEDAAAHGARPG